MSQHSNLIHQLRTLLGILELDRQTQLYRDTITICNYLEDPVYRIAVFAPFNHGKSTLLNALLGNKTLPIDIIPTTGAAIYIGYGKNEQTTIAFKDGTQIQQEGINLKQYAILDENRRMKDEVAEIRVTYNHPWLNGVEFLDLPGTNDREAQNDLVQNRLLGADLIIQVLDVRKLMTLEEREHLQNWLQNRGITTVIFVANFLNLLTKQEQQEVKKRLYLIAESFRSDLPPGISNIYCVDALPALRARLKGNQADAQTSGITSFESALQTIISIHQPEIKLPRVIKIAEQLLEKAATKQQQIEQQINLEQTEIDKQIAIKQKAERLIQQGFERSISEFQSWLYLPKLLSNYQPSLAIALQQARFDIWLETFKADVYNYQQAINKWVNQGCDFFQYNNPQLLAIDFPKPPAINIPEHTVKEQSNNSYPQYITQKLNFLRQKKAGAVVLGGATYIINKIASKNQLDNPNADKQPSKISSQVYIDAAELYLTDFSDRHNVLLNKYEKIARKYITFTPAIKKTTALDYQLQLLNKVVDYLKSELNIANIN